MRRWGGIAATAAATALAGCGQSASGPLGAWNLQVDGAHASLAIAHPTSGLSLTTGAGGGFFFRSARAHYEESEGSFLITETEATPWKGAARFSDAHRDGQKLLATLADGSGAAIGRLTVSLDGKSLLIRAESSDPRLDRAAITFACDDPALGGFLGFGSQSFDVDHRGQIVPIWVSEDGIGKVDTDVPHALWNVVGTRHQSYLAVPTTVAPRPKSSFGLHATTFRRSIWDLCSTDPSVLRIEVWEGAIEVGISPGPSPLEVIEEQTSHSGRAPPMPDWGFGVWMERIGGTQAVLDEADLLRRNHVPVSAIWSEDWRGGDRQGMDYVLRENWRLDPVLYSGVADMIARLHAQGIMWMTYFNTFIEPSADVWNEAVAGDHLVKTRSGDPWMFTAPNLKPSGMAELFRPETKAWVEGELKKALSLGIDGWMGDFGEWYAADPNDVVPADKSDPEDAHHRYPIEWNRANHEALANSGRTDAVVFQRSGYTGSQALVQALWAGDQRTDFEIDDGLPTIIPMVTGLGVTGFPIVTHDIAGYTSATNPPSTKALFFRWTILGALNPIMRTHHGRSAFANWRWSSDQETIDHFVRWSRLHTRLFPVWKGLAEDAWEKGYPILRPVALFDPADRMLQAVTDTYMIGDALLVAPVVTASVSARSVPLPKGLWYDFTTGEAFTGPMGVMRDVPLTEAAIFARAGAIVPMLPEGVESLVKTDEVVALDAKRFEREVYVWLGADGAMREAEGGSYALHSPARPMGQAMNVEGASMVVTSAPGHAVFEAQPNTMSTIVDAAGMRHAITTQGMNSAMKLRFDVRW